MTQAHDELLHRFTVARWVCYRAWTRWGVGARNLGECLQLQLRERLAHCPPHADASAHPLLQLALRMCPAHGAIGPARHQDAGSTLRRYRCPGARALA